MKMIYNYHTDMLGHINAMRSQEERIISCHDYFPSCRPSCIQLRGTRPVDKTCRKAMVDWCFKVADAFNMRRETVWIAMSFLDRYLSSGKGKSSEALQARGEFQLAALTSFYIAVKLNEPCEMSADFLVNICRNTYTKSNFISTEEDILFSLEWRVSGPTPMDFVRNFLELLPQVKNKESCDNILQHAQKYLDCATSDIYFSGCKASTVGIVCLFGAFVASDVFTSSECDEFLLELSSMLNFDIASTDVIKVQERLLSQSPFRVRRSPSQATLPQANSICFNKADETSSPVSVADMTCSHHSSKSLLAKSQYS